MVLIIIVTHNGELWIEELLDSVRAYDVMLIDNGSTDSTRIIAGNSNLKKFISLNKNLGFGATNNLGLEFAMTEGYEFVLLLNQDVSITSTVIENLVTIATSTPSYGILSPVHLNGKGDSLDYKFLNYLKFGTDSKLFNDLFFHNAVPKIVDVPFVNAAVWLIRKNCLQTVGFFDNLFYHYGEDDNYCQRVRFHNFRIGIVLTYSIKHHRPQQSSVILPVFLKEFKRQFLVDFANVNLTDYQLAYRFGLFVCDLACRLMLCLISFRWRSSVQEASKIYLCITNIIAVIRSRNKNRERFS